MTDTYRELFRSAGRDLDDYVKLIPLDANYRVTFGDGDALTIRRTLPELVKELERIEPGVTPRFYRFLEDACHKYRLGRSEFVERDFEKAGDFFGVRNLRLLLKTRAVNNYYRRVSKFFASDKLRQAFSLQTMYLGLSPFEAPAVYSLLPYTELAEDGLWFPEGGMYSLIEAMERLATELGVRFHLNSPVERVVVTKGRATGVRVNGEEFEADAVLANADLPYAYRELLGGAADGDFKLRKREKLQYTASAFMLYLGVDGKLGDMVHHNFYLSGRYEENFEAIFRDHTLPDDPSFYAVVPTKTEPRMAPDGMESLFVLVPVPHLGPNVDWDRDGGRLQGEGLRVAGAPVRARPWARGLREGEDAGRLAGRVQPGGGGCVRHRARHLPGRILPPADGVEGGRRHVLRRCEHQARHGGAAGYHRREARGRPHRARGRRPVRLDPAGGKKLDGGLSLAEAYELCRKVQKAHSRTYYFSTRLFPPRSGRGCMLCTPSCATPMRSWTHPHDLPLDAQLAVLEEFEAETMEAVSGEEVPNPILRAYADTVRRCGIDPEDHSRLHEEHEDGHPRLPLPDVFRPRDVHLRERRRGRPHDVQGRRGG